MRDLAARPLLGIVLLVSGMWVSSALDASGKWLMTTGVSLVLVTWTRYAVHSALCLGVFVPVKGASVLRSRFPRMQILRATFTCSATLGFLTTLSYLPQAEATAINFLAPLMTLTVAPFLLKERTRLSRWIAASIGFIGVMIIIRPDGGLHPVGTLLGLMTAALMCGQHVCTRKIAGDDPLTSLIWTGMVGTVLLTPVLLWQGAAATAILSDLSVVQWVVLVSTGVTGSFSHLLQIGAYRNGPASTLAPFIYLQIVSAAGFGWLVWGQFPDALSWLGIAIICASGIGIGLMEWHSSRVRLREMRRI